MKTFLNKVVVITGAASGFGKEIALKSAEKGMKLVLADIQIEKLKSLAFHLKKNGAEIVYSKCDVRITSDIKALSKIALDNFGSINILFNNAGVVSGGQIWENSEDDWDWVIGVNVIGNINCLRIFVPIMLESERKDKNFESHIINTASIAGLINTPNMGIYNASKHGVISISETLYHDLSLLNSNIGVSVLCPFYINTNLYKSELVRPEKFKLNEIKTKSQEIFKFMLEKAITSSKVSSADVVDLTFKSIKEKSFYIFSHQNSFDTIRERFVSILSNTNPVDPYMKVPHIREKLINDLK